MDLVTGIGLVMGILSTADLAYKYLPALSKKDISRRRAKMTGRLGFLKKSKSRESSSR